MSDEAFWLYLKAPFAAFRPLQAGAYRATLPTIPHSAAWGLVLNLAGIEIRSPEPAVTTGIRPDAPSLLVAVGAVFDATSPRVSSLYQQLHSYPVGASGKELQARAHGAKYWIAPGRRELLVDFEAVIGVRTAQPLRKRVAQGLQGELRIPRYGLPFAGENDFLFDRIDLLDEPPAAYWYTPVTDDALRLRGVCRLTIGIDRADAAKTTTGLFAPVEQSRTVPSDAWVWTPRST